MKIINKNKGNQLLMDREKTLFLCSKHAPFSSYDNIFHWVETLSSEDCVMCFDSSELEEELLKALLINKIPTILFVINKFKDNEDIQIKSAIDENRLLIVELQRDEPRGKGQTPRLRNEFVANMAKEIVCGYVNPNGSIFPLLAGRKNVRYLEKEKSIMIAAESGIKHPHWKVNEDKTLLRMFYEDMGLYAIKKKLGRSYQSTRNRIRSLALTDDVLKGREFEEYVLGLLNVSEKKDFTLLEWRGDKMFEDVRPENNSYPDFIIKCNKINKEIAIECKWRSIVPHNLRKHFINKEQQKRYEEFSKKRNIPVFLFLGVGGDACQPKELYVIPLDIIHKVTESQLKLKEFKRDLNPIIVEDFNL